MRMKEMIRIPSILLAACCLPALAQPAPAPIQDFYHDIVGWQQPLGVEVTPIHVGLLPTGKLFFVNSYNFFENPGMDLQMPGWEPEYVFLMEPTPAFAPLPPSVTIQPLVSPPALQPATANNILRFKTLACSGHALMADGNLFFASGVEANIDLGLYASGSLYESLTVDGIAETFSFDPVTQAWTQRPNTVVLGPVTGLPLRWYATVTRLADSRMLITGGYETVYPAMSPNSSVEVFDPATNTISAVSSVADTPPGIENPDYPHVFQYPYATAEGNTVMVIGGSGEALYLVMSGEDAHWINTGKYRPGAKEHIDAAAPNLVFPNYGSSSTLLPIRLPGSSWGYAKGSVLYAGGAHHTPLEGQIDVFDPVADAWRPSIPMHGNRHHPATVLLPDGRVLVLAGHDDESPVDETGYAEYVDPANNFTLSRGTDFMPEVRGYHSLTVLLPDGRVLIGSGNVDGRDARERPNFRYYYPDYMFKPRPSISVVQETLRIGENFLIAVPHGTPIGEAALMGLGSMTHSYDMNQRHVQLAYFDPHFTVRLTGDGWLPVPPSTCAPDPGNCLDLRVLQAPTTPQDAPPGHYMLFILDQNRVPSEGRMVRLES